MRFQYILTVLFLLISTFPLKAEETEKKGIGLNGWIQSPLLNEKREFKKSESQGVTWFLERLEKYEKPKEENNTTIKKLKVVASLIYDNAIQIEIYSMSYGEYLKGQGIKAVIKGSISPFVQIKKNKPHLLFPKNQVGKEFTYQVGNMKCDLILDSLTIPFGESKLGTISPEALLPYLGEQYGAGILSHAITWRLVDRGLGWPEGYFGDKQTLMVANELKRECLHSPSHLNHNWCLLRLKRLAKISKLKEVQLILDKVEKTIKTNANKKNPE
jgi:hypothetical protein